jgi:hypothetical protein
MKKLHVKMGADWLPVFCHRQGEIITCPDTPEKALPPRAIWGSDDLAFFRAKYANHEFALMNIRTNAK